MKPQHDNRNRCTNCEKSINSDKEVWLELSNTDGNYYHNIPTDHVSQGCFAFGPDCAKKIAVDKPVKQESI